MVKDKSFYKQLFRLSLPASFLSAFVLHLPLWAVYLCTRIDQLFKWIIALVRLRGDRWIKNVTRETA